MQLWAFNQVQILFYRQYINYTELGRSSTVLFFKCINISDINIEKSFEILSVDIILMVYSLYRARKERYSLFSNI